MRPSKAHRARTALVRLVARAGERPVLECVQKPCLLPDYKTTGPFALQWFSGLFEGPLKVVASWQEAETETGTVRAPLAFADADDVEEYDRNLNRVRIAREIWELQGRKYAAVFAFADVGHTEQQRQAWFDAIADAQQRIDTLMERYGRYR